MWSPSLQHSELSCNTSQSLQVTEMSQTEVVLTARLALGDNYVTKALLPFPGEFFKLAKVR